MKVIYVLTSDFVNKKEEGINWYTNTIWTIEWNIKNDFTSKHNDTSAGDDNIITRDFNMLLRASKSLIGFDCFGSLFCTHHNKCTYKRKFYFHLEQNVFLVV